MPRPRLPRFTLGDVVLAAALLAAGLHSPAAAAASDPPPAQPKPAAKPRVTDVPLPPPPGSARPGTPAARSSPSPSGSSSPSTSSSSTAPAQAPSSAPAASGQPVSPGGLPPFLRPTFTPDTRPQKALRLAVPDIRAQGELPPRQLALLEQALLAELRKLEGVSAIGMGEIREMLSFEHHRRMLGCSADEACLAEIGGALGTDEMLNTSVVVEGKTATFELKRINMRAAKVTATDSRRLTRANGEELLGAVGPGIQALFPDRALRAGRTRGVDKEVALRLNPPPLPRWPFVVTASAAGAALAGGAVFGYLSRDSKAQYRTLAQRALGEPVSGLQLQDLEQSASSRARTANILLATGGVLALAAGVEAFFTDWHGYRLAVEAGPQSGGVGLQGKF